MDFTMSDRQREWLSRVQSFMKNHVRPAVPIYRKQDEEGARWKVIPIVEELKKKAKAEGLWNMFMPPSSHEDEEFRGAGLTNLEYAPLAEEMGHIGWASEVFNCSAPDTGNMEVFIRYGTKEQKRKWLRPLMDGEIRSAFLMTEPAVASSDATNIETRIERDGDHYVINGRKWWSSGVGDPRCKIAILMGKTDPKAARHQQQSQILVPLDTPGITVEKLLPVFGFDDAPHGHAQVLLENVRVPASNILLGEGRGFRDRARPSWSRPYPSLHAHHRQGRGGAGEDGEAAVVAHRLRQEDHRIFDLGAAHRGSPHRHRDEPPVVPEGRRHDGQGRQQDRAARNRHDQGRGAQYGAEDHRSGHSGLSAPPASPTTQAWRGTMPRCAPCGLPTVRTKSTTAPLPGSNFGSMPTLRTHNRAPSGRAPRGKLTVAEGVRSDEEFSGTKPVEERHRIDEVRLDDWMRAACRGLSGTADRPAIQGRPVEPDLPAQYARPFLCDAAQAVRETVAVGACGRSRIPRHLRARQAGISGRQGLCALHRRRRDWGGLLHHVDGRGAGVLGSDAAEPAARGAARDLQGKIETLAKLHTYDPQAIGLGEFGKPGNYFARQVDRWTKQYRASETQHIEEVEKLIEWLPRTVPQQERVSIVHGDYRLDNMIFHPTEPRVIAVLDWELSTLGDPMADFTYLLMQWTMPGLANADLKALNIPTLEEAAKIYCDVTGSAVPDLNWYFSYNLFRLACITQGIAGRIRDGTAASAKAMESAARTVPLSKASWDYAQKAGAV